MPFVETQTNFAPLAVFEGKTAMEAAGSVSRSGDAVFAGKTAMEATGSILLRAGAIFAGATDLDWRGRLDDEPNWFGTATFAGKTEMTAKASIKFPSAARFEGSTVFEATGRVLAPESSTCAIIVDIVPHEETANYQDYGVRLTVGGVIVPITVWDIDKADNAANKIFSATINEFTDKQYFTNGAVVKFEIDTGSGWQTEFHGAVSFKNFALQNDDNRPNDSFSFTCADDSASRLNFSPPNNLVIYDPLRTEINAADFEPIYDTAGRAFALEGLAAANLRLFDLFQLVFVARCGFAAVRTNLPDYPLRQASFDDSGTYLDGVAPFIGMFDPIVFPEGSTLWMVDPSNALPAGFPSPRLLEASRIDGYQSGQTIEKIDAFDLQCAEAELGEYFTRRTETEQTIVGASGDPDYSRTVKATTIREYRLATQPLLVIGTVIEKEVTGVYDNSSNVFPIDRSTEIFTYDALGRAFQSTKTIERDLPDLPGGETSSLQLARTEKSTQRYGVNPFDPKRQIQKGSEMRATGLIAMDTENQFLGKDFPQDFVKATEAGNLKDGMNLITGTLETVVETFKPQRNGQVKVKRVVTDFVPTAVGRKPVVTDSFEQPRSGDVSLPGKAGKVIRRRVFLTDDTPRTAARIEDFGVGELPLEFAVPLARRRLLRKISLNEKVSANLIGLWQSVREGAILSVHDREQGVLVQMIVEGYKKHGDENKTYTVLRGRQIG